MIGVIKQHTSESVELIEVSLTDRIVDILNKLYFSVVSSDIVFCPWAIPGNYAVDVIFSDLADRCWVVTAAGNNNESIENWTPARVENVITVGTLNKSGNKASLSNFSDTKKLEWVTGTNYKFEDRVESGTSISAALYTAFLAESIRAKDAKLLDILIKKRAKEAANDLLVFGA
jgi:hypothetical protein